MLLAGDLVLLVDTGDEVGFEIRAEQALGYPHRARRVGDIDHRLRVVLLDLHRSVRLGGGGTTDQERQLEALALHLLSHMHHLVQRRGDETGETDHVGPHFPRRLEDGLAGDHDPEVDDLEVVALQHHPDDVFADVVHIPFHGRQHDFAVAGATRFLRLDIGLQIGDRPLHHPRRFHHLRQEHLAGAEQIADHVHAIHQRPFDDMQRPLGLSTRLLGILFDEVGDPLDQRMLQPLAHRPAAPRLIPRILGLGTGTAILLGDGQQLLGGVVIEVEHHRLDLLFELGRNVFIDGELTGVDDPHVHAVLDGVVEEDGVNRFPHRLVATE